MNELRTMHLFAGVGGGLLADIILGHRPIIAVEWDAYACQVLRERAADGWFPGLQVWEGDVRLFDPSEYTGKVDCIHAGFPCQDISVAGKQAGVSEGTRSGLYREVLRIAGVVRPKQLFLENVSAILSNGLGTVLGDLAEMGYDCRWLCIRASDVGAPHHRDRWFLLANSERKFDRREIYGGEVDRTQTIRPASWLSGSSDGKATDDMADSNDIRTHGSGRRPEQDGRGEFEDCGIDVSNAKSGGPQRINKSSSSSSSSSTRLCTESTGVCSGTIGTKDVPDGDGDGVQGLEPGAQQGGYERPTRLHGGARGVHYWSIDPADAPKSELGRVANGIPNRVGQLKGYGNAQVPLQAATAYRLLGGH